MKNLFYLCAAALLAGCAANAAPGYKIAGSSKNVTGKVYLQVLEGKTPRTIDSVIINADGTFAFEGNLEMPMYAQLADTTGKRVADFYIENAPLTIAIDPTSQPGIKVTGSKEDSLYRAFMVKMDSVKTDDQYFSTLTNFVKENPTSVAAAYVMFRMLSPGLESSQIREYVASFDTTVKNSVYLKKALDRASLMDNTAVGKKFSDFSLADTTGKMVKLSDVAGKGNKWVLLDFWASWCSPCRAENPEVVKAFEQYKDKGFTVFGVSLDKDKAKWVEAIGKDKLTWTNVSDLKFWDCEPAKAYGVSSIPSNVLIAPDGTIAARNLHGAELHQKLAELLPATEKK